MKAGKAIQPSGGICGKVVDARLDFAAYFCVWEDLPVSIPGKKRNRTGRFRGEFSPEELTVAVTSLEEEPGQSRVFQDLTTGNYLYFHVLLQCVKSPLSLRAGFCRTDCFGSPRKFWAMCPLHFSLRRDFTVLLKDTTC